MKLLLLIVATAAVTLGQGASFTASAPLVAKAGTTVPITVSVTGTTDTGAAALQWSITLPAGYTATATAGASIAGGQASAKTLSCTATLGTCIVWALNTVVIPNGAVAVYNVAIPATATGTVAIPLTGLVAASPAGMALVTSTPGSVSLIISVKQDLNGDGIVNLADAQLEVNQVLAAQGGPCPAVNDMNGDGKCDVLDVENVVLKSLGII